MVADLSTMGYNNCNMASNNINNSNNAAVMRKYSSESSCDDDSLSTLNDDDDMNYFEHLPSPTFGARERQLLARKRRHVFRLFFFCYLSFHFILVYEKATTKNLI
jgi:hypothetical protein